MLQNVEHPWKGLEMLPESIIAMKYDLIKETGS
jgi:hypothetical protein